MKIIFCMCIGELKNISFSKLKKHNNVGTRLLFLLIRVRPPSYS